MAYTCQTNPLCPLTLVLLATAAVSPPSAGELETLPPLWDLAPGHFSGFPTESNRFVINAWNYSERLGMYKILVNHTASYFRTPLLEPNNDGNILWGLPLQHGWQFITGMNYYLAIIPFLGALESGMFGDLPYEVEMVPPNERREDFCLSIAECNTQAPKVMLKWRHFFKYLLSTTMNSESLSAAPAFSKDEALKYMWDAHVASINYAFPKFQNRLPYLSGPESNFGKDWSKTVDYIAATRFPTDLSHISFQQTGLPPRMLLEGDKAPFISDFTPVQNTALFLFSALRKTDESSGQLTGKS
ncbi:hypothetical protein lerEdw1_018003 [Lerista edwardsae]|nr:hypothetical protein lerEdw1_018003 [Lerista edwardsae]